MSATYRKPVSAPSEISNTSPVVREMNIRFNTDDTVAIAAIGIKDVDKAVESFIVNMVNPSYTSNNQRTVVPVMYASPEKWNAIQTQGYYRDEKNRLLLPLIAFKRESIQRRDNMWHLRVKRDDVDSRFYFNKKYSQKNRYDQFSKLVNRQPLNEYYSIAMPEFVSISYTIIVWTNYLEQLNDVVANFIHMDQRMGGDSYKFTMMFDSYSVEVINESGADRMAKATIQMHSNAYLVPRDLGKSVNLQKMVSVGMIKFGAEVISDVTDMAKNLQHYVPADIVMSNYYLITEDQLLAILTEDGQNIKTEHLL